MSFDVDSNAIQDHVVNAIINSSIGEELKKAIEGITTHKVSTDWNAKTIFQDAVDRVVKEQVAKIALDVVRGKESLIREIVAEKMTDSLIREVCSKIISEAFGLSY